MSENNSEVSREVAVRVFAGEYERANHTFKESDEQRAPRYILLPSGVKANRVLVVGTLTETEEVSEDNWRGRIADPTGAFNVYAGEYEPEAQNVLANASPPHYVAVVGKPRTYETDDGDIRSTLRPENIIVLDGGVGDEDVAVNTRRRWVQETARQTLERINTDVDDYPEHSKERQYIEDAEQRYGEREKLAKFVTQALESLDED